MVSQEDQWFEEERRRLEREKYDKRLAEGMAPGAAIQMQEVERPELERQLTARQMKASRSSEVREVEEPETPSLRAAVGSAWGEAKQTVKEAPARVVHSIAEDIKSSRVEGKLRQKGYHEARRVGAEKAGKEQYEEEKLAERKRRELLHELDSIEAKGRLKTRLKTYEIHTTGRAHADVQQMKTVHVAPIRPRVFRNQYGQIIPYDPDPLSIYSLGTGTGQVQESGYDVTAMYRLLGYNPTRPRIQTGPQQTIVHHLKPTLVRPESREQGFSSVGLNNFINTFLGGGKVRKSKGKKSKKVNIFTGEGMF